VLSLALSAPQLGWQRLGERTSDALWPWAEGPQPPIAWLRAAGYLVEANRVAGLVDIQGAIEMIKGVGPFDPRGTAAPGPLFGDDHLKGLPYPAATDFLPIGTDNAYSKTSG
jgi:hypothetical protein